jgi:hypothetical protein
MFAITPPGPPTPGYARFYVEIDVDTGLELPYFEDSSGATYPWPTAPDSGGELTISPISGTTYTVVGSDLQSVLWLQNSAATTVNLPTAGTVAAGFNFEIYNQGAEYVAIVPDSPDVLYDNMGGFILEHFTSAEVIYLGSGQWKMNVETNYANNNVVFMNNPTTFSVIAQDLNKLFIINASTAPCTVTLPDVTSLPANWNVSFFQGNTQTLTIAGFTGQTIGSLSGSGAYLTAVPITKQGAYVTLHRGEPGAASAWYMQGYIT